MPDLMIEHIRTCSANLHWQKQVNGSIGKTYNVYFGPSSGPYSYGWICDCPSFNFGKQKDSDGLRTCKHIEAAKKEKCDWNWEAFMGHHAEANPDGTCPKCGQPTGVIRVGV